VRPVCCPPLLRGSAVSVPLPHSGARGQALFHVTLRAGQRARSKVMLANAWHHRSDAASSAIAIVGASGAMVGGGAQLLDPLAGMLVSALIVNTGWRIGRDRRAPF
jgi:divalent metal cation (Fe/Co/Zn/Cd) transporter